MIRGFPWFHFVNLDRNSSSFGHFTQAQQVTRLPENVDKTTKLIWTLDKGAIKRHLKRKLRIIVTSGFFNITWEANRGKTLLGLEFFSFGFEF